MPAAPTGILLHCGPPARIGDKGNGKEAEWAAEREIDIWKWELLRKRNKGRGKEGGARYGYGIKRYKLLVINDKDV